MKNTRLLIDFEELKSENIVEISELENNSIPLDLCAQLMIQDHSGKPPFIIINLEKILNENIKISDIFFSIINQAVNLNFNIDFKFNKNDIETIKFLAHNFFTFNKLIKYIPSVIELISDIIIYFKDKNIKESYSVESSILDQLCDEHLEYVSKISGFLDSIPLFILTSTNGFIDHNLNIESEGLSLEDKLSNLKLFFNNNKIDVIEDIDYIPRNTICLFYNQLFLISYYSSSVSPKIKYYLHQFNSYMYNGNSLIYYFDNTYNFLFHTIKKISESKEGNFKEFLNLIQYVSANNLD